jgi:hypothetical protein
MASCGSSNNAEIRIYATSVAQQTDITSEDLVPRATRVERGPGTSGILSLRLNRSGISKFHELTRELARRGAQIGRPLRFIFEFDGRVYARPGLDYREFPDGISGNPELEISGLSFEDADRIADAIRED